MSILAGVRHATRTRTLEALTPRADRARRVAPRGTVMGIPKLGVNSFLHPIQGNDVQNLVSTLIESEQGNMSRLMPLYDDMRERDPRLDAVCRTRVLALTGKDWTLRPPAGMERDASALEAVERMTRALSLLPSITQLIAQLMDGALRGYSVVEMEWGMRDGVHVPVELYWRDPSRFAFDDQMVIHRSDTGDAWPGIPLSDFGPDRFIIHSPSGGRACYVTRRGALRPCLWPSMTKRYGLRWWLVAAERFGQPAPILKVPDGDDNLFDDAADMLRGLNEDWQAVITEGMELELLPGSGNFTGELHSKMVDLANTEMAVAILGQNLSTEVQGGSYAAAKVHDAVRLDYLAADASELADTLRRDLLEPIMRYNWPGLPVPNWQFTLVQPETAEVQEWHVLGGVVSINETREALGFAALNNEAAEEQQTEEQAEEEQAAEAAGIDYSAILAAPPVEQSEPFIPANMIALDDQDWSMIGTPEEAVKRLAERLNPWARATMKSLRDKLEGLPAGDWRQSTALFDWAEELRTEGREEFETIAEQTLAIGEMGGRLSVAGVELGADRTVDLRDVVQLNVGDAIARFFRAKFDEAIAYFERKQVVSVEAFDSMRGRWKQGGFIARRLANTRLVERARQILADGMNQQLTGAEMAIAMERQLGLGEKSWYAETIVRTNLAASYGAGRFEQMTDPEIRGLRPYVQYKTANDRRVRDEHRHLDRKVFMNGSELHAQYAPPLGFNCRCQMVTLSERQFERRNLSSELTTSTVIIDGKPYTGDKGWTDPAGRLEQ